MIEPCIIVSISEANHTATIVLTANPTATYANVPISSGINIEHCAPGAQALVKADLDGCLVVIATVLRPTWPKAYYAVDTTLNAFTAQAYTAYPNLSVSITHQGTVYYTIMARFNGYHSVDRNAAIAITPLLNSAQTGQPTVVTGFNGRWLPSAILHRAGPISPGTHTVGAGVYVYTAGDTQQMRYSELTVLVTPA